LGAEDFTAAGATEAAAFAGGAAEEEEASLTGVAVPLAEMWMSLAWLSTMAAGRPESFDSMDFCSADLASLYTASTSALEEVSRDQLNWDV
jgi:hypothetical protein